MKSVARILPLCLALAAGCHPTATTLAGSQVTSLEALRERYARNPRDMTARRDRALAELVAPGGDLTVARDELRLLAQETPRDARVRFATGLLAAQHGEFDDALAGFIAAVDAARDSTDPLAPVIAEAAVPEIIALRGDVRDFDTPFRALVSAVERDPGRLGADAHAELMETAVRWSRERGDRDATTRWVRAAGCVTSWRVAGPFGPLPMLRFDETLPPESRGAWPDGFDLGPGRGTQPTYAVQARGCAANLGHGITLTGVLYAATDFSLEHDGDVTLRVESPNAFTVFVDGTAVATLDPRRRAVGSVLTQPLHLAAGAHALRVKIASSFHSPLLIATLTDPAGRSVATFTPGATSTPPSSPVVLPRDPTPADDAYLPEARRPEDPFARYAWGELAYARRHPVAGRELMRPLATAEHATPMTLIAWGSVALADPFMPRTQARDRARHAFEQAAQLDAGAYQPPLQLARLAAEEERADEALRRLRDTARRFPENAEVIADYAERLLDRNWDGEARAVLDPMHTRLPDTCWPTRMLLTLAQRHGDGRQERALEGEIRRCDALSDTPASGLARSRHWDEADQEYARLLQDDPEGRGFRRARTELSRARGNYAEAAQRARELLPQMPEDDALRADLADVLLGTGHRDEARAMLDAELARRPAEMAGLYRLRAFMSGREDLAPWRLDGRAVLRDFEASGHTYESSAVLVLDYTVRRNFSDGSALELTHNVIKIQAQEGVEQYGEFTLPDNATLWQIRTLKADGRVLEPESVAGKDSLSLPDLHPGDAVEFEYVRTLPPTDLAPGGFVSDRFYFRGFEVPYDRSEFVVIAPHDMEVLIDPRGPAPETHRAERDGLTEYRWVARESHRMTPEPHSVSGREFIPSIAVGVGATWTRFVDALRSRLIDQDVVDPEAQRLVAEVTATARTRDAKLARIHRWVIANIQQEGAGTPFESAPRMLAARAGHRTRVLCYMLNLAEVPCEIALVRQGSADATQSNLADDDTYQSIMLRVQTETGARWVTAADNHAPVAYVPPAVAGGDAMLLSASHERAQLPALDLDAHGRSISVDLTLTADGAGHAVVTEHLRGYPATGARGVFRRLDGANRERQFEAYVGSLVAGASLESLRVDGVEDPEQEMSFRYAFSAPGMANRAGETLTFDGLFHAEGGRMYAELPSRTVPLWNAEPVRAQMDLTVHLPSGARIEELPQSSDGHAPGVSWSLQWERTADGFHLRRRVDVPTGRVTVADYAAFAASVRALDQGDTRRVVARVQ